MAAYAPCCLGALGLEQVEKVAYARCSPRAQGLETLSLEKAAFSPCSPGALGLETLSHEKATFSCSLGALGLDGFEREEESLMYERIEQASACLK
jgi:hypothetical protein